MKYKSNIHQILLFIACFWAVYAGAQPQVLLTETDPYNLKVSNVVSFQIIPGTQPCTADMTIQIVSAASGEKACEAMISDLAIGNMVLMVNTNTSGYRTVFTDSRYIVNDLIRFGKYKLCVTLKLKGNSSEVVTECRYFTSLPVNPPMLMTPSDGATINELNPMLGWIPPVPVQGQWALNYHLKLTEIFNNQSALEAIRTNQPLYENNLVRTESMAYPYGGIPLVYGKSYAWQIAAYDGNTLIGTTEVWKFMPVKDSLEQLKERFKMMSFAMLLARPSGESYTTSDNFCIQFMACTGSDTPLEIIDVSHPDKVLAKVPMDALLDIGDHKYVLNLAEVKNVKQGSRYTLRYKCASEMQLLNFQYQH